MRPNKPQEQTGGCYRGSAAEPPRAFRKPRVSGASEDFVPPAAQRRLVRRANLQSLRISMPYDAMTPRLPPTSSPQSMLVLGPSSPSGMQ